MRVAVIGLGAMGSAMAGRLLEAGHEVAVQNRDSAKEDPLVDRGAERAATPRAAAAGAGVVITSLSDEAAVRQVLVWQEGVIQGAEPGTVVVDTSTIAPEAAREVAAGLKDVGVEYLDAPVSGGVEGARSGGLSFMVGGEAAALERARPVLEVLGSRIVRVGPVGHGQLAKAVNQVMVGGVIWAVAEGLSLGLKSGLDMDTVLEALRGGAAGSWVLENRGENILEASFPAGFRLSLHRKDLGIALAMAARSGAELTLTQLAARSEDELIAAGFGDEDVAALARAVRKRCGLD